MAKGHAERVESETGPLAPVVVAAAEIPQGAAIGHRRAEGSLEVRRVPERFVPPGALRSSREAIGLLALAPIPHGSYVLAAHLGPPEADAADDPAAAPRGSRPVDVTVSGGEAVGALPPGTRVDVLVTRDDPAGGGRTAIEHAAVTLLGVAPVAEPDLGPDLDAGGAVGRWVATLAVTRRQAVALVEAEAFARDLRLLPRPEGG